MLDSRPNSPRTDPPRTDPPRTDLPRITVGKLVNELLRLLSPLGRVQVVGEASGIKRYSSGLIYFTLKEGSAAITVRVPPQKARFCEVKDGDSVVVTGSIEIDRKSGSLTLTAVQIQPVGEGAIAALIASARERMRADGLLDRPRLQLPVLPRKIVVVCGADAAVLHDFRSIAGQRFAGFPIEYVQANQNSVESILEGLNQAQAIDGVDVIVLARGGGDSSALLPYSDELLCRAIAASSVFVVSAIGHESDRPLCDELSDLRAPTPTAAAMLVVPDRNMLLQKLDRCHQRAYRAALDRCSNAGVVLESRSRHLANVPKQRLAEATVRVRRIDVKAPLMVRLNEASRTVDGAAPTKLVHGLLQRRRGELNVIAAGLRPPEIAGLRFKLSSVQRRSEAAHPQHVLQRGYSVVKSANGTVIRAADDVSVGETLEIVLASGTLRVSVIGTNGAQTR